MNCCARIRRFYRLCGQDALKNVILATTKWGDVTREVGLRREQQLAENHWKDMLDSGAKMAQFNNTQESAWAIVDLVLQREHPHSGSGAEYPSQ
jgi:hypothetical protein